MGAGTECGAPGHARRKPGREAGGWRRGGRAESQQIDSPAASRGGGDSGPGPAAATASRVVAPRDRRGPESRSESRRGGEAGSLSQGCGRRGPAPRGTRRAAGPALPLPRGGRCPGRLPTRGGGALGRWALLGVFRSTVRSGPVRSRGVGGAGWPAVRGMGPWGFLNGVKQAQGSFHCTALPLRQ